MTVLIDIDQLRTFIAIAETGSFTKAAEVVHKTQSAVSMQMKRLEERLDKPIFARDGRASKLTEDGERLLDYARRIVKLNLEALAAFSGAGAFRARAARRAGRLCRPLSARNHGALLALLSGRRADGDMRAVGRSAATHRRQRSRPRHHHRPPKASAPPSRSGRSGCCGSRRCGMRPIPKNPLPLALGKQSCAWRRIALECLEELGRPHRVIYTSSNAGAYVAAVLSGLAVSVVPESTLRPGMRVLTPADGFPELPYCRIGLVRNPHESSALADALAEHIISSLDNLSETAQAAE